MGRVDNPSVVGDLGKQEFAGRLGGDGVGMRLGPFNTWMQVGVPDVQRALRQFYAEHALLDKPTVFSFHLRLEPARARPRFYRRTVRFTVDGRRPHSDMPRYQALPIFEWGLNLVIALRCYRFLMLHAAVLERGGKALLLPAAPGDGKSTLCAALAFRGWRLFSDEFGLLRPGAIELLPIPRPIALKDGSIDVIRDFAPEAQFGPLTRNTRKGDVAHVSPPPASVRRQHETAPARLIVFPRWQRGASLSLEALSPAEGFMQLARNAFNYDMLGEAGFESVCGLVAASDFYRLRYGDLHSAVDCLNSLAAAEGA